MSPVDIGKYLVFFFADIWCSCCLTLSNIWVSANIWCSYGLTSSNIWCSYWLTLSNIWCSHWLTSANICCSYWLTSANIWCSHWLTSANIWWSYWLTSANVPPRRSLPAVIVIFLQTPAREKVLLMTLKMVLHDASWWRAGFQMLMRKCWFLCHLVVISDYDFCTCTV